MENWHWLGLLILEVWLNLKVVDRSSLTGFDYKNHSVYIIFKEKLQDFILYTLRTSATSGTGTLCDC